MSPRSQGSSPRSPREKSEKDLEAEERRRKRQEQKAAARAKAAAEARAKEEAEAARLEALRIEKQRRKEQAEAQMARDLKGFQFKVAEAKRMMAEAKNVEDFSMVLSLYQKAEIEGRDGATRAWVTGEKMAEEHLRRLFDQFDEVSLRARRTALSTDLCSSDPRSRVRAG